MHHLHITNRLSFEKISLLFASFSNEYLIVEFIPITDNKVQILLKDKIINLFNYNEIYFTDSLTRSFNLKEVISLKDTERRLFLFEKKK